eukprot:6212050-Pleurochrysis_carterae.AAC.1
MAAKSWLNAYTKTKLSKIYGSQVRSATSVAMLECERVSPSRSACVARDLELTRCVLCRSSVCEGISKKGCRALANGLKRNTTLRSIDFTGAHCHLQCHKQLLINETSPWPAD